MALSINVIGTTAGPNNPSSAATIIGAGASWVNPSNVYSSNDAYASVSVVTISEVLNITNFGFSIPAGSTINGITVEIEKSIAADLGGIPYDLSVTLGNNTGSVSEDKADTLNPWTTTDTYKTYGGATDTWGRTWTTTEINDARFGVRISVTDDSGTTFQIDHAKITVYYTTITGPTVTLNTPANNTINKGYFATFNCSATSTGTLSNITLNVWNSTGALVLNNKTNIGGAANSSRWVNTLPIRDVYKWNCLSTDTIGNSWAANNFTYTSQSSCTYSGQGDWNLQLADFCTITANTEVNGSIIWNGTGNITYNDQLSGDGPLYQKYNQSLVSAMTAPAYVKITSTFNGGLTHFIKVT